MRAKILGFLRFVAILLLAAGSGALGAHVHQKSAPHAFAAFGPNPQQFAVPPEIVAFPRADGGDDWPTFIPFVNSKAGLACVRMYAGTWHAGTPNLALVSNACIVGSPGVSIVSTMPSLGAGGDGHTATPFYSLGWTGSNVTTMTAPSVYGSPTITVASASGLSAGNDIGISGLSGVGAIALYQIVGITVPDGGGSATLTLDRGVVRPFASGSGVMLTPGVPRNIRIYGNGMTLSGVGDRGFELEGTRDCLVRDMTIKSSFYYFAGSFDNGGVNNRWENVNVDFVSVPVGAGPFGLSMELQEGSSMVGGYSDAHGLSGTTGYLLDSCFNSHVEGVTQWNAYQGLWLQLNPTDTIGNVSDTIADSSFVGNSQNGILISGGSDIDISNVTASGNGLQGLDVTGTTTRARVHGGAWSTNANYGIIWQGGNGNSVDGNAYFASNALAAIDVAAGVGHKINGAKTLNNTQALLFSANTALEATSLYTDEAPTAIPINVNGVTLTITNWTYRTSGSSSGNAANGLIYNGSGGVVRVNGVDALFSSNHGSTSNMFTMNGASTLFLGGSRHYAGAVNSFAYEVGITNGAALLMDGTTDAANTSATNVLHNFSSGSGFGFTNFGNVTCNGATGVTVALGTQLPLWVGESRIILSPFTAGGTVGVVPHYSIGTNQWTLTCTALDTSVWHWRMETMY